MHCTFSVAMETDPPNTLMRHQPDKPKGTFKDTPATVLSDIV